VSERQRPWTAEQTRGITTIGRSLLVSAAAGAGKTSVLSQRCVHLVCDAKDPCDVDDLLIVPLPRPPRWRCDRASLPRCGSASRAILIRAWRGSLPWSISSSQHAPLLLHAALAAEFPSDRA